MPRPTVTTVHPNTAPLVNISVSYKNEQYIGDQIFPSVAVNKKSDFYFVFGKGAWYRNRSGMRAPGTRAPRADYDVSNASYLCINDSLAKEIPDEVRDNADAPLSPDIEAVEFVTDGLLLGMEIRVANLTTGGSALWTGAASPATQWTSDTSDPFTDIQTGKRGVVDQIGRMPNVMAMSWDVWSYLETHPDYVDRIKYTRPGAVLVPGDLQAWHGFSKVLISPALKDNAQEGLAASIVSVWGDGLWMGYVSPTPSPRTPSAGYVFTWGTRSLDRFREDQEKQDVIAIEHFVDEKVAASDAGYVIYNAI